VEGKRENYPELEKGKNRQGKRFLVRIKKRVQTRQKEERLFSNSEKEPTAKKKERSEESSSSARELAKARGGVPFFKGVREGGSARLA